MAISKLMATGAPQSYERLDERTRYQEADIAQIKQDVREIKTVLSEARGGWRVLMFVAGAAGTLGAMLTKMSAWLPDVWR